MVSDRFFLNHRSSATLSPVRFSKGVRGSLLFPSIREAIRIRLVNIAIIFLKKHGPAELSDMNKEMAVDLATKLSVHGVQKILDQEGYSHCGFCTQRFGLRKIGNLFVCNLHHDAAWSAKRKMESSNQVLVVAGQ